MVAIAQRDVSTKNNRGRVGSKSKETSSLSSSLDARGRLVSTKEGLDLFVRCLSTLRENTKP